MKVFHLTKFSKNRVCYPSATEKPRASSYSGPDRGAEGEKLRRVGMRRRGFRLSMSVAAGGALKSLCFYLDDQFHETAQSLSWTSIKGMRPFRASHMIRTLEALD